MNNKNDNTNEKRMDKIGADELALRDKLTSQTQFDFYDFVAIMKILRAENGCVWDKAQTHESIKINLIEEAYELVDAIDFKDAEMMREECGDVLMQAVFHTEIAEERGEFDMSDMLRTLCRKLIDRHTHIFGANRAFTPDEALVFWNDAKKKEKKYASVKDAMEQIPKNLPSLLYAEKLQKRAKREDAEWTDIAVAKKRAKDLFDKFIDASNASLVEVSKDKVETAGNASNERTVDNSKKYIGGELLFAIVNIMRLEKVDPEIALRDTCNMFLNE